jgi:hypothetical protein
MAANLLLAIRVKGEAMIKGNIRILGQPKPPQEGVFSSKVAKKTVANPKAAKKSS